MYNGCSPTMVLNFLLTTVSRCLSWKVTLAACAHNRCSVFLASLTGVFSQTVYCWWGGCETGALGPGWEPCMAVVRLGAPRLFVAPLLPPQFGGWPVIAMCGRPSRSPVWLVCEHLPREGSCCVVSSLGASPQPLCWSWGCVAATSPSCWPLDALAPAAGASDPLLFWGRTVVGFLFALASAQCGLLRAPGASTACAVSVNRALHVGSQRIPFSVT